MLPVTTFGRYVKILLSSNEFLFVELTVIDRCRIESRPPVTRREALCRIGNGFGMLAFASLVGESLVGRGRSISASGGRGARAKACIIRRAPSA